MTDRWLISSFTASSLIHLALLPLVALVMHAKPLKAIPVPIELVQLPPVERPAPVKVEIPPPPPPPAPKPRPAVKQPKITAPKLVSKPVIMKEKKVEPPAGNVTEKIPEPEPVVEPPPPLAALPDKPGAVAGGWNDGAKKGEAEGGAAGVGSLFAEGDTGVVGGSGIGGGGGGKGKSGLGRGAEGDGAGGGGTGSGEALSGLARPLGGYQIKPRYPESARRAGIQGVTTLKVRVLENGRVGQVLVERSAGFRDLDMAAAEAVKKWLFEPARRGKEPVSVWVMLPVKFELR